MLPHAATRSFLDYYSGSRVNHAYAKRWLQQAQLLGLPNLDPILAEQIEVNLDADGAPGKLSLTQQALVRKALTTAGPTFQYDNAQPFTYTHSNASVSAACASTDDTTCDMLRQLFEMCAFARVSEGTRFLIQLGDASLPLWWPHSLPVVSKQRRIGGPGMILPLHFERHWGGLWASVDPDDEATRPVAWSEKRPVLHWRGGPSGIFGACSRQRARFVHALRVQGHDVKFWDPPDQSDARYYVHEGYHAQYAGSKVVSLRVRGSNTTILSRADTSCANVRDPISCGMASHLTHAQQMQYKYLLSLESHDTATQLKWWLASGSVVVMPTPTTESWLCEGQLVPWVHYVPLDAPTDASKVLTWLQ